MAEGIINNTCIPLGVFREGGPYIAWLKDPSGNVLSVLQEKTLERRETQ
jgi:hypothetical protein